MILLAICNVALMSGHQPPAPTGVLVGVHRYQDSASTTLVAAATLRTLWLEAGGRVAEASGLLLPRRTGVWWLDLDRSCTEEPVVDFNDQETGEYEVEIADDLRASPVETRPAPALVSNCVAHKVRCVTDRRIDISWVWPDFVSMNRGAEGGCGAYLVGESENAKRKYTHAFKITDMPDVVTQAAAIQEKVKELTAAQGQAT